MVRQDLSESEIQYLRERYKHLTNYQSADVCDPIDPLTYVDSGGDNLLHIAAYRGDVDSVKLLLKAGMNVNEPGELDFTPLHYAYMKRKDPAYLVHRDEVVGVLLAYGASTTARNSFGQTPIETGKDEDVDP
ncbi:MAG: ankyrin repeat domain-containing protein [Alphaproteobacteria bacterium]|nr:ankyrin repeat domain-containing protein [Alphaproteobacteria bacterium]